MIHQTMAQQLGKLPMEPLFAIHLTDIDGVVNPVPETFILTEAPVVSMSLARAPSRTATITTSTVQGAQWTYYGNLTFAGRRSPRRYELRAGWRALDGDTYWRSLGLYSVDRMETAGDTATATLVSSEAALIGAVDLTTSVTADPDEPMTGLFVKDRLWADLNTGYQRTGWTAAKPPPATYPAPYAEPTTRGGWGLIYGTELWERFSKVLQVADLRCAPDDDDRWRITRTRRYGDDLTPSSTGFTDGAGGQIIDAKLTEEVGEYIGAYAVIHQWVNAAGAARFIRGTFGNASSARVHVERRTDPTDQASATAYARSRYRSIRTAYRGWTITALADPALRPESPFTFTVDGTQYVQPVKDITFQPLDGTMTLTTRSLD